LLYAVMFTTLVMVSVGCASEIPPGEEWNKTFGGIDYDVAHSVQQTSDSGYIVAGFTRSYGAGESDFWLVKTDSKGNEQWNKTLGGHDLEGARSVQQTSDGGYIIAGLFRSRVDLDYSDFLLVKTDSNGNEQWNKTFGGVYEPDFARQVQQSSDGGYIIVGITRSYGAGWFDLWLIKTDSKGNEQWNKTFGGNGSDAALSVQQTSDGGYIIGGHTFSYGAGDSDLWLVKTDSNANEQWNKTFGGTDYDVAHSVQQTSDGGYILAGETRSYSADEHDFWLVKTDSKGNEQWNRTFGGNGTNAWSVQQTSDGGYILAGNTLWYRTGRSDFWLAKTDSKGNEQWNKTFGGTGSNVAYSVQQTSDSGYIIAGKTDSFGAGDFDFWLIKIEGKPTEGNGEIITPEVPTEEENGMPGFEAIFAIAGLLAVTYLLKGRG
jgi:PGF-CTERM protein